MPRNKRSVVDGKLPCSKCGEWKAVEEFDASCIASSGRRSQCRPCEGRVQPRGTFGRPPIAPVDGQFRCRVCGEWKPVERFEKKSASAFGRTSRCCDCGTKKAQEYWNRSPRNYLRFLSNNLRRTAGQRSKRSAESFSKELLHNLDALVAIYEAQHGLCAVTGVAMTYECGNGRTWTNISIDRINPTEGYVVGNVRLVCVAVNLMRNEMTDAEMRWWASKIVDNH